MSTTPPSMRDWIGRSQTRTDVLDAEPAVRLAATIGSASPVVEGGPLPPLWHWIYFVDAPPTGELGPDGHARRGEFLPPVGLPRRMWAGGRVEAGDPIRLGSTVTRTSTILDVAEKTGSSGELCFVTIGHELVCDGASVISETQNLVYRAVGDESAPRVARPAPRDAEWSESVTPTPVLLFRYSALTFNSHRIHYDADYARDVENLRGLVVHGPLVATLLVDLAMRNMPGSRPATFEYRAVAPIVGEAPFLVEGRRTNAGASLWARTIDGILAMSAEVTLQ